MAVASAWKKTAWSDTKATAGIGDGTMSLVVEASTGRVTGELEGPLGPAILEGAAADGALSATVRRRDPSDRGFAGTLVGSMANDRIEGTMSLSLGQASAVRGATFSLSREPAAGGAP
jgi:hypothetical protein